MTANHIIQLLKNSRTILLIDWPDISVPLSLLKAGFKVISYSPDGYSRPRLVEGAGNKEKIVFENIDTAPDSVDIVNIFRPEEEHEEITASHVLPLNAKAIWLHPPVVSSKTAELAAQYGLIFIEGRNIALVAQELSS